MKRVILLLRNLPTSTRKHLFQTSGWSWPKSKNHYWSRISSYLSEDVPHIKFRHRYFDKGPRCPRSKDEKQHQRKICSLLDLGHAPTAGWWLWYSAGSYNKGAVWSSLLDIPINPEDFLVSGSWAARRDQATERKYFRRQSNNEPKLYNLFLAAHLNSTIARIVLNPRVYTEMAVPVDRFPAWLTAKRGNNTRPLTSQSISRSPNCYLNSVGNSLVAADLSKAVILKIDNGSTDASILGNAEWEHSPWTLIEFTGEPQGNTVCCK